MKKRLLNYLKWLKISSLLILIIFPSCKTESNFDVLAAYFVHTHNRSDLIDVNAIVVIDDKGGCLPCSRNFAKFISIYQTNTTVLFLILASGTQIDISTYDKDLENVYFDLTKEFAKTTLLDKSGIIVLDKGTIKALVQINAENSDEVFNFIEMSY